MKSPLRLVREGNPTTLALLLLALVLGVFLPSLGHGFVNFDDDVYVYSNAHVPHGLTRENLHWALWTLDAGFWHPLTWLSLLLDGQLYGLRPGGYHLTNLLFHAANTILLFLLWRRMTGATWRSAFVAALFAAHPIHVEPVAWISNRKDLLSALFWMLSQLMYVFYAEVRAPTCQTTNLAANSQHNAPGAACQAARSAYPVLPVAAQAGLLYLLSLSFFLCSLMSKTMAVTLPLILLLMDWWPLKRFRLEAQHTGSGTLWFLLLEKLPFLAAAFGCGLLTMRAERGVGALQSGAALTLLERVANAILSYVRYLGQTLWPRDLAVYYPYPHSFAPWQVIGAGLLLLIVSGVVLWAARRQPYLPFGWIWYVVTLLPVIGLIQVGSHSHADHYTYVPLIGIFSLVAWGVSDLAKCRPRGVLATGATAGLVLGLCVVFSRHQLGYWQDSETLLRHAIAVTEDNDLMHNNLGALMVGQGRLDEAIEEFRVADKLHPDSARVHDNIGAALAKQGKLKEAMEHLREAIRLDPEWAGAHNNLGAVLGQLGRFDEAMDHLQTAVKLAPRDAGAHCNLADAFAVVGRLDEAIAQYQAALTLTPDDAQTRRNLGVALAREGRFQEAIVQLQQAVESDPKLASAQSHLANVLLRCGRPAEAAVHYQAAIDVQPSDPSLLNNLAWVLATCPLAAVRNGPRAVELAEQAERLSGGNNSSILGTLAAAYAEAGRSTEAVAAARRALDVAGTRADPAQAASLRAMLGLFQGGAPFRDAIQTNPAPKPTARDSRNR
ncbi:MAG TPA: tetratricopeptide repeat protein [Candidatus Acidoferrum sp.]|nr:tetratricopeptide repeat protein [Candidatus Acidoferrum sp.]